MLNKKRDHGQRPESAARPPLSIGAMAYADELKADYKDLETRYRNDCKDLETGYRNGLYNCIGRALTSYRKFLKDTVDYKELLGKDNIAGLREKPDLKKTSRLVLYHITGARNKPERNAAGKLARVVDYLHREGIGGEADAAEYIRSAGGLDAILKKARGREALRASDETRQDDVGNFEGGEDLDETRTRTSASGHSTDELFDADKDLSIRVTHEVRALVLSPALHMGELFYLECKKTGAVGRDGIRIVGRLPPSA
jgi:hypothetical protein